MSTPEHALLDLPGDIDDRIVRLARANPRLTAEAVVRDIARIACLGNLLGQGFFSPTCVLGGGMAMRCYQSKRLSVYDVDTAAVSAPAEKALRDIIDYEDDDIRINAAEPGAWSERNEVLTAQPILYEPYFTGLALAGGQQAFSLSVASRGLEIAPRMLTLKPGYPFRLGPVEDMAFPVMDLKEILAEKVVAWWLFGHPKHYADIAFIAQHAAVEGWTEGGTPALIKAVVGVKLETNRPLHSGRVAQLDDPAIRRSRLEDPDAHLSADRTWDGLSFLATNPVSVERMLELARGEIIPLVL